MKFSQKILLLPTLAFLAFLAFFLVGRNLAEESGARLADIEDRFFRQLEISAQLERLAVDTQYAFSLAIANDEEFDLEHALAARESFLARIEEGLAAPRLAHEPMTALRTAYISYYDRALAVARTALSKPFSEYTEEDFRDQMHAREQYNALIGELAHTRTTNRIQIDEAFRNARLQAARSAQALRLTAAVTVALLVILSVGVILSIVRPLRAIMTGTEAIASGDLYQTIDYRSRDDLGRLADSFRKMQKSLIADIGRRKTVEAQLRTNEERLALAFDAANDGLWDLRIDTETTYLSPRFFSLLGYRLGDIEPSLEWVGGLIHPDEREQVAAAFSEAHLMRGVPLDTEVRIRSRDGTWRWVHAVGKIVEVDTEGRPTRSVGTISDVTQRKDAEQKLQAAQSELVASARGAGMAEIATSVLHNVGNVLNSATTSASILAQTLGQSRLGSLVRLGEVVAAHGQDFPSFVATSPQGRKLPEFLVQLSQVLSTEQDRLREEVVRLNRSHDHIKEIIALQQSYAGLSGVVEELSPRTLVEDALQLVGGTFERHHIEVEIDCERHVPRVRAENHLALQILVNLLKNSRDAIKERPVGGPGKVGIAIRRKEGGFVDIAVTDNGVGIEPEILERIFTYGFTTKSGGHGFGLHGAANAAREMGGALEAFSEGRGRGATFIYTLPAAGSHEVR